MKCEHYNGDGYTYKVGKEEIDLCEECEEDLFTQMYEQDKLEEECK